MQRRFINKTASMLFDCLQAQVSRLAKRWSQHSGSPFWRLVNLPHTHWPGTQALTSSWLLPAFKRITSALARYFIFYGCLVM